MTESPRRTTLSMPAVVAISLFGCAMSPTHAQVMRTSIDSSGAVTVTVYEIPGSCDQALVNEARRSFQLDDDILRSRSDPRARSQSCSMDRDGRIDLNDFVRACPTCAGRGSRWISRT